MCNPRRKYRDVRCAQKKFKDKSIRNAWEHHDTGVAFKTPGFVGWKKLYRQMMRMR
jgi:hypothetical protein